MPERTHFAMTQHPEFPIVVSQPKGYAPVALWALQQENIGNLVITREFEDDTAYSHLVADAWQRGGFVLVEHDIIPWWGAVRELWECEHEWCVFPYPQGQGDPQPGLGCVKFSESLVKRYSALAADIRSTHWAQVQEKILPVLWNDQLSWHQHWPPLAHARQRDTP